MGNVTCNISDCEGMARKRGWCEAHYKRWRTTGDVQAHIPLIRRPPRRGAEKPECSLGDCVKPSYRRTWCRPHYNHWVTYGDPLASAPTELCAWPGGCDKLVWITKSRSGMCAYHAERVWKRANRGRMNASNRRYARKHPERVSAWNKKWRYANPDKQSEYQLARLSRLRGQFVERVYRSVLFRRDKGLCGLCGKKVDPANWHMDHIVPLSRGGEHSYANTQVSHPFCNVSKGARLIEHQLALL